MVPTPERNSSIPALPEWINWLQAGLTTLLVVLFIVMLGKSRQQSANIRLLQEQVQGLQNSRELERTTALEEQLRSTVERLQTVERATARLNAVSAENSTLRSEVRQLRAEARERATAPEVSIPPLPPLKPSEPAAP